MTKLILYTDEPFIAGAFAPLLPPQFQLTEVCSTLSRVLELMRGENPPDVALLDLTSEITFAALSAMKRPPTTTKVVLLAHAISTELAFQAMGLGVRGILRKTSPTPLITQCLELVQAGELWFDQEFLQDFVLAKRVALTPREGQLVRIMACGLKNKEIATALQISEGTVKVYLSRLYDKLGVNDRLELALYAIKNLGKENAIQECGATIMPLRSIVMSRPPAVEPVGPRAA